MSAPKAIISDFGGVLTSPLLESFAAVQDETGIPFDQVGLAMAEIAKRNDGVNPLFQLEKGEMSEADFLDLIADELEPNLGHRPAMHRFSEVYFKALQPNQPMIDLMCELRDSGLRMAMLTNNVREWEPRWRAMLPVDEIFELVVDSAFVGMRKPEPEIYQLTLERLAGPSAEDCLFIDDIAINCDAAEALGIRAVHYRQPEQAMAEIREAVSGPTGASD